MYQNGECRKDGSIVRHLNLKHDHGFLSTLRIGCSKLFLLHFFYDHVEKQDKIMILLEKIKPEKHRFPKNHRHETELGGYVIG